MEPKKTADQPPVLATGTTVSDQPSWFSSQDIWGKKRYKAQVWSFVGYAALIAAVYAMPPIVTGAENGTVIEIAINTPTKPFTPFFPAPPVSKPQTPDVPKDDKSSTVEGGGSSIVRPPEVAPPSTPPDHRGGGGGGGKQEATRASGGDLAPFASTQMTAPMPVPLNQHPEIAVPPTLVANGAPPINLSMLTPVRIGDPLGDATAPPSSGTGKGGGIGNEGDGKGIGNGKGPGAGPGCCAGIGGGLGDSIPAISGNVPGNGGNRVGNSVVRGNISEPQAIRQTRPPYSEAARKNKVQGTVILDVVVQADGSVDKSRVKLISGPGYGLDESAIDDVKTWMFKPATQDGRPIPRTIRIEVRFALR